MSCNTVWLNVTKDLTTWSTRSCPEEETSEEVSLLILENDDYYLTEDGRFILLETIVDTGEALDYLLTQSGDTLLTELGEQLYI